ncbi:mitogen-activated protein kinase kinase kinase 7-like [Drosophila sulfurigaster albostrigata]|uniref:mitogen-activated protein kinase kinase kinase 7-like n=1 Tax=Drosophila sulfurigaster albostrigata TaxID=89887 RepID=UPI002D21C5E9|nr:mitogen-activated protein kinase kinase kinase 7-like [Drosophila sulfurigaster albostrigata]XP_062127904.1 mitogen-activated protein kinase kinase kinase 7-like [Drosophila sulfurigaster albostrigata]
MVRKIHYDSLELNEEDQAEFRKKTNKIIVEDEYGGRLLRNLIFSPDNRTEREFTIHNSLNHVNIVKLIRREEDENANLFFIYEYADCGTVYNYLCDMKNRNEYSLKLSWMVQCARALAYMHGMNPKIVHNDLRARHLLLCDNFKTVKIFDFSKATLSHDESKDIRSFGILLWEILVAKSNNDMENDKVMLDALIKLCYCKQPPKMIVIADILESIYQNSLNENVSWSNLELGEILGQGNFGLVYKARWMTQNGTREIAIKRILNNNNVANEREVRYLRLLKHENIMRFYGTTMDNEGRIILAMEYADGGTLDQFLHHSNRTVSNKGKLNWMLQCAKGVAFLHKQQPIVIHRDLKPQNLLLYNNYRTLKLCDFGTVRSLASISINLVGTAPYMAPEVSEPQLSTEKCDVFSFGILCWEIMTQRKPFAHLYQFGPHTIINKIRQNERPSIDQVEDETGHIKAMIKQCWDMNPIVRPTMRALVAVLSIDLNSYVANNNMINLLQDISDEDFADQAPN